MASTTSNYKSHLEFILNPEPRHFSEPKAVAFRQSQLFEKLTSTASRRPRPAWRASVTSSPLAAGVAPSNERPSSALVALVRKKRGKKKTTRTPPTRKLCGEPECTSRAVSRGHCVRHGGGSRCSFPDCTNGAKIQTRCFQHGGSVACMEDGCTSKAKRYGYCWAHGGGRICSSHGCKKVAAQHGLCWAHGGGNRCLSPGCAMRSYEKNAYFCKHHAPAQAPASIITSSCDGTAKDQEQDEPVE